MLHIIKTLNDPWIDLLKDDPVRPSIPAASRVHDHAEIFVELGNTGQAVAAFYTIWSYSAGAGRELIQTAQQYIKETYQDIERFVTLSPKTEMARRFHLNNGAATLQENAETTNYEYPA